MAYTVLESTLISLGIVVCVVIFTLIIVGIVDIIQKFNVLCDNVQDIKIFEEMKMESRRK